MRKVILYIAMSLDGYIADKNGGVAWLEEHGTDSGEAGSYEKFIQTIDTVILGYKTYHQIVTELSPNHWVYSGMTTYVLTHRQEQSTHEIIFTDQNPADLIEKLKSQEGKGIWICGGASIVNQLVALDLINGYHITVIPTILGDGIRLFEKHDDIDIKLKLVSSERYNGMVDLVYERRK